MKAMIPSSKDPVGYLAVGIADIEGPDLMAWRLGSTDLLGLVEAGHSCPASDSAYSSDLELHTDNLR